MKIFLIFFLLIQYTYQQDESVINVTEQNFESFVQNHDYDTILLVSSGMCQSCSEYSSLWKLLNLELKHNESLQIGKVNIDKENIPLKFDTVPTIFVYGNQKQNPVECPTQDVKFSEKLACIKMACESNITIKSGRLAGLVNEEIAKKLEL